MSLILLSIPTAFLLGIAATLIVVEWQARKAKKRAAELRHNFVEWFNKHTF
jgi:hypothetical protein